MSVKLRQSVQLAVLSALLATAAFPAATITIVNGDGPGEGFNDPTPAAPVGGNTGTTVGEQRLIAFQHAAQIWGGVLNSSQPIAILARFDPLACDATTGVLGSAGASAYLSNFPGAVPNTWYPIALAEKIANTNLNPIPTQQWEINATFNSNVGTTGCIEGSGWYYGLDNNSAPTQNNLVVVLLHEFGHGLGFSVSPTSAQTGRRPRGSPSVWENFVFDITANKSWASMTPPEVRASAVNTSNLVWTGGNALGSVPSVLRFRSELVVAEPASVQGVYEGQPATFGAPLTNAGLTGKISPVLDTGGEALQDGCEPYRPAILAAVKGNIALVQRGVCSFVQKAQIAQAAGAVGILIANNASGLPPMGGTDPAIVIPALGITQELGNALRNAYRTMGRNVVGTLKLSTTVRQGTDPAGGRPRLYAPNPFESGSSVSHWDISLAPNQLMEPALNIDLTQSVVPPQDLTLPLLVDIGW